MADFCARCGKTLSLIDPLLELKGLRFCEDCYPDVKREHAAASMSDKMDRKNRAAFADDESDENLRGSIIKGKQALIMDPQEFTSRKSSPTASRCSLRLFSDMQAALL